MRISNNLPPILDLQEGHVDRNAALEQLRGTARSLVGPDQQIRDIVTGLRAQLQSPISDDALKQFQTLARQMKGHWPALLHAFRAPFEPWPET